MTTIIELKDGNGEDIILGPPVMGISTSGDAAIDVIDYLFCKGEIKYLEKTVENNIIHIEKYIKAKERYIPGTLIFTLIRENDEWLIEENNNKLLLKLHV